MLCVFPAEEFYSLPFDISHFHRVTLTISLLVNTANRYSRPINFSPGRLVKINPILFRGCWILQSSSYKLPPLSIAMNYLIVARYRKITIRSPFFLPPSIHTYLSQLVIWHGPAHSLWHFNVSDLTLLWTFANKKKTFYGNSNQDCKSNSVTGVCIQNYIKTNFEFFRQKYIETNLSYSWVF